MTKTIYTEKGSGRKEIWLEIIENRFMMVVHKIGDRFDMISGRDDREREVNIRVDEMEKCLGVKGGNAVVNMLIPVVKRGEGMDGLVTYLDRMMVSYNYFTF